MFVKPANLGSSVGISKAKDRATLLDGMDLTGATTSSRPRGTSSTSRPRWNGPRRSNRLGRVHQARKRDSLALAEFEYAIRHARRCPPPILATVHLETARLYERLARRDRAIAHYRVVSSLFGAGADSRTAAARALTRLRAER